MEIKTLARTLLSLLHEMPVMRQNFLVDYYVVTPKGSRTRFQRSVGMTQIQNAQSETAVLYYLKRLHPGCDVILQSLVFR